MTGPQHLATSHPHMYMHMYMRMYTCSHMVDMSHVHPCTQLFRRAADF